jgi:hypothetical protein
MIDPNLALQQLMQLSATASSLPPTSRYYGLPVLVREDADGKKTAYFQRRFVPQPERFELLQEHRVTQGERLDNITAQYLGSPEMFWRLCDANRVLHPRELEQEGFVLRITLPEGIPGTPNAQGN